METCERQVEKEKKNEKRILLNPVGEIYFRMSVAQLRSLASVTEL